MFRYTVEFLDPIYERVGVSIRWIFVAEICSFNVRIYIFTFSQAARQMIPFQNFFSTLLRN